jgi:hypothetical protein
MGRKVKKGGDYKPTVQVTRAAKDRLAEWIDSHDRPAQSIIVGKVLNWFLRQPAPVQTAILSNVDEGMERAYAKVLEKLAADLKPKNSPATNLLVDMTDRRNVETVPNPRAK